MKTNLLVLILLMTFSFDVSYATSKRRAGEPTHRTVDTAHILAMSDSGVKYAYINTSMSAFYCLRALQLSDKAGYRRGTGVARFSLGLLELIKGNYDKSLAQFLEAGKIFASLNDTKKVAVVQNAMGTVYMRQFRYKEALDCFYQSLQAEEKNKNLNNAGGNLLNIGSVCLKMDDFEKAKYYYHQALTIFLQLKNESRANTAYTNLAAVLVNMGKVDSALYYYQKAADYFDKSKDAYSLSFVLISIGGIYKDLGQYDKAFPPLNRARTICKANGMREFYSKSVTQLARLYYETGDKEKALQSANEALVISKDINQLQNSVELHELLYNIYKKQNKTNLALVQLEELNVVKDSLQKAKNLDALKKLDSKYLTEKLQQKELFLQQQSSLYKTRQVQFYLILTLVFLILIFVLVMFYIKHHAAHRKNKILEQETEINKQKAIIKEQENALYEAELNKQRNEILAISALQGKTNEALLQIINDLRKLGFQEIKNAQVSDNLYKMASNIEKLSVTDSWSDFRKGFTDVHPLFYENLNKICPSLTINDLKLASLIRMNLSSKEIASLTLRSLDSIHIARHRLRKKLEIEDDNKLVNFLFSVPS
jgi:tetratricopeptide (TPR) repeat protein